MSFKIPVGELAAAMSYKALILEISEKYQLDPAVVAGVGSRESGWGTGADMKPKGPSGTGDWTPRHPKPPLRDTMPTDGLGFGRGLMQADWDWSDFARKGAWQDPRSNIHFGCKELAGDLGAFTKRKLSHTNALQAALAAYNHGFGNVWKNIQSGDMSKVDVGTANGNYSKNVLERASAYAKEGFTSNLSFAADEVMRQQPAWPAEGTPAIDQLFGPIEIGPDGLLVDGWQDEHLTRIESPWPLTLSWDHSKTTKIILCNKQVSDSLTKILIEVWTAYEQDYSEIARARMHLYGGCFEFRRKRGLSGLSLHAYGAAIDFDPEGNPMYYAGAPVDFHMPQTVVDIFAAAGWRWGNNFTGRRDPMHFQATS